MMLNVALSYDVGICQYIQKAWREQNVMNLMADDHIGCTLVTLSVALWACWHASSFEEGHLSVENAGGDADTHSAVACAILGAKYGYQSFRMNTLRASCMEDIRSAPARIFGRTSRAAALILCLFVMA